MILAWILFIIVVLVLFAAYRADKKSNDRFEQDIQDIITNHTEFVKSLDPRQLEYYKSMDHSHLSREILKLEQRVYDLEKPNLPH